MTEGGAHSASSDRPFLVGITGGLGAGKSTVCSIVRKRHPVLASDDIAKELLANDEEVRGQVIEEFGPEAYGSDGTPNRQFLADIVFNDPDKLETLNDIVHPATVVEMLSRSEELYEQGHELVFVESALLFEAGVHVIYDCIIAVIADTGKILERLNEAGGLSPEEAEKRMEHQLPQEDKETRADLVIKNNGTREALERSTNMIITIVESMAKNHDAA